MRGREERPVQLSRVSKGRGTVQGGSWGEAHSQDIVTNALEASEGVLSRDGSSMAVLRQFYVEKLSLSPARWRMAHGGPVEVERG